VKQTHTFEIFADYFQFYLEDEGAQPDTSGIWDKEHVNRMLATYSGLIAVGTARNMKVPVKVIIDELRPSIDAEKWDKINECSIIIKSDKMVVIGCTDYYPDAARITITPGIYRVVICYGGLNTLSEDGLDGNDHYEITLWPEIEEREVMEIK